MNRQMQAFTFHLEINFHVKANLKMMAFSIKMINYWKFNHMERIIFHNNIYTLEYILEMEQMILFYFNMEEIQSSSFSKLYIVKEMSFLAISNKILFKILKKIHNQAKNK